jgi:hypothetical protein
VFIMGELWKKTHIRLGIENSMSLAGGGPNLIKWRCYYPSMRLNPESSEGRNGKREWPKGEESSIRVGRFLRKMVGNLTKEQLALKQKHARHVFK